jgi:hypothetical protein
MPGTERIPRPHEERCALRLAQTSHKGDLALGSDLRQRRRSGYKVVLDEAPIGGQPDRCEEVTLGTRDEDVCRDHGPPGGDMQPGTQHDRRRRRG